MKRLSILIDMPDERLQEFAEIAARVATTIVGGTLKSAYIDAPTSPIWIDKLFDLKRTGRRIELLTESEETP